ncbi:spermine synthase [Oratosquilla oratoria]|uniref:spermine synthase n=1 Tax=Oratosquilla oratoria TaxID=337810 RepID=UPI003F75E987
MAGHSVPVDFKVDPAKVKNPVERTTLLQETIPLIQPFTGTLKQVCQADLPGGHFFYVYASDEMSFSIKMYSNGLVSCTVDYYTTNVNEHRITNDDGRCLERQLTEKLNCSRVKVLPALKRAPPINPYFTSSDDRLLEYDVDSVVFEEKTDFQKVQVYHTKSFGNLLVLDDLQNLAESDLPYTHGLMNKSDEDYKNKEILILGGGDGALLYELLKEDPAFVTMIDIDDAVMRSCKKHLKTVCGNVLDNYNGSNYKVIVGDAIAFMKDYAKEDKTFDYVFADLTDVPISKSPRGELWDFIRVIMNLGCQLLKPGTGKYMTHAIGIQCEGALQMFEEQLSKLNTPVTFQRTNCYVPSFMENWCFYQATRKPVN